ncbi:hypothetical protein YC2023_027068 [Brassica napus]
MDSMAVKSICKWNDGTDGFCLANASQAPCISIWSTAFGLSGTRDSMTTYPLHQGPSSSS